MKKVLDFGKIDYNNSGRKNCKVTIEVELREKEKGLSLAISGNIWNPRGTDCYSCGQNIDEIAELFPYNKKVQRIKEIWEQYHLNDLTPGTPKQEAFVKQWRKENNVVGWAYDEICTALKNVDLYEDNGYKYGHGWLLREIPAGIIEEIKLW